MFSYLPLYVFYLSYLYPLFYELGIILVNIDRAFSFLAATSHFILFLPRASFSTLLFLFSVLLLVKINISISYHYFCSNALSPVPLSLCHCSRTIVPCLCLCILSPFHTPLPLHRMLLSFPLFLDPDPLFLCPHHRTPLSLCLPVCRCLCTLSSVSMRLCSYYCALAPIALPLRLFL